MPPPKPLPHSPEAEIGVLGSILVDHQSGEGTAWDLVIESGITECAFTDIKNKTLFTAIKEVVAKGMPVDLLAIIDHLHSCELLDSLGGIKYVQDLIDKTPTVAHLEYYIRLLKHKAILRGLYKEGTRIASEALDETACINAEVMCASAEATFSELNKDGGSASHRDIKDIASIAVKEWDDNAHGLVELGIQTGIPFIDNATGGILRAAFWTISGKGGSCKSTLCRMIAESIGARHIPIAVKSTEKTVEEYVGDMVAAEAGFSVDKLNRPNFPIDKLHFLHKAKEIVAGYTIDIDDSKGTTSQWASWYKSKIAKKVRLVILDYLQHVKPENKLEEASDEKRVSNCSAMIQEISKSSKVPAICVSTLSNEGNMRYSGNVQFDTTLHIQMSKHPEFDPFENPRYVAEIMKSRYSPAGTKIDLYYSYGKLITEDEYMSKMDYIKNGKNSDYDFE